MQSNPEQAKTVDRVQRIRKCPTCLYMAREEGTRAEEKCLRFARFVDHMLNENSRDCEYWQPTHAE